uniref:G-protein coupled receptors family 1 profile domain-containing protein n=1 Tax=Salarias fasciatus TaxID=181472 RepID=A0A672HW67_SALFA
VNLTSPMGETELCFPQLLNASCWKPKRPLSEAVFINSVLSFISLLTASLNLLVIISISHFKQLHTPTNLLLLSLAVSDFFVGLCKHLLMSFQIVLTNGCWFFGDPMCVLYSSLDYTITSASVGTMVLISVDRYVAICDPLHYSTKVTVRRVSVCICLCWFCSFLYNSLILRDNLIQLGRFNSCYGECVVVIDYFMGIVDTILTFVGPVTVIIIAVIFQLQQTVRAKRSEMKAAKTLGVVVAFLTCLCPYYCSSLADQNSLFSVMSVALEIWLFYLNSCLNPVIYAFCYPWFLKSVRLIVTLKIFQPHSCDACIL